METVIAACSIDRDHKGAVIFEFCIPAPIPPAFNSLNLKPRGFDDFAEFHLTGAIVPVRCQRYAIGCEKSAAVEVVTTFPLFDPCLGVLLRRRTLDCRCSAIDSGTATNEDECCQNYRHKPALPRTLAHVAFCSCAVCGCHPMMADASERRCIVHFIASPRSSPLPFRRRPAARHHRQDGRRSRAMTVQSVNAFLTVAPAGADLRSLRVGSRVLLHHDADDFGVLAHRPDLGCPEALSLPATLAPTRKYCAGFVRPRRPGRRRSWCVR